MQYEVEQKFPVADLSHIEQQLLALGATPQPTIEQRDRYFAHPSKDFAATDEALRIRRVGEQNFVTYKGPRLDAATKTRRELELPLESGESGFQRFSELLEALGFRQVAEVHKTRRPLELRWQDRTFEAALDQVTSVGSFVELELIAEAEELASAREALQALAGALQLGQSERRSYLEMLLAASQASAK